MDGARGAREESDVSANRSGAAMYPAFEADSCIAANKVLLHYLVGKRKQLV
jgi:hypothetical protein